ncbi:MAG: putative oxidase, partial [Acidimicrobiales bacterium]|nr:putative oxidase [Acidimicrobiales bacterium]
MALRNRIVLPGMDMNHCDNGVMTSKEIEHYAARAEGGCALVTTGASAIAWPIGSASWHEAGLGDDRFLPGLARLADAVHAGGAKLSVQLVHHGKVAGVDTAEGRPLLVPSVPTGRMDMSALADNSMDELIKLGTATRGKQPTYRVATADDIAWLLETFADAAGRVQAAGGDAVEIHGAHGYLINTFLSREFNQRTDEYGGSLENRCRLLVEVIGAVRARVGDSMAISVRLNGCEYGLDDGITIDETVATARIAEAAGADVISISAQAGNPFRDFTKGPLPAEVGQYRPMAAAVKAAIGIPVIAVGRLLPELAEEMLA